MKKILIFIFLALPFASLATEKASPTLQLIMQNLGKSMDRLNRGIFYEDFKLIEDAASKVANHPKAKSQLPTVIRTLKARISKFKNFDRKVHKAAMDIISLAKKKDMSKILNKHRVIMNNCVACHTEFRSEISQALSK